jgi:ATP-binding cassette subfamily C protein CydC/ATP-binding cassette subfamily C protein CydCD
MRLADRQTIAAGLLGAVAVSSGVALTATSGWLIVRASEKPVILTLLTAIVAVRAFGMARPVFRYWERLRSHDAALADLARERTSLYAALVPLTPARLVRRGRAAMLTGVVDDLTDRVEARVRVTVPVVATTLTALFATVLCWLVEPVAGVAVAALAVVVAVMTWVAWRVESRGHDDLGAARAEVGRVSELVTSQGAELQAIGAQEAAAGWLDDAHTRLDRAVRRQVTGRALAAAVLPAATAVATVVGAVVAAGSDRSAPVLGLLVLAPFALAEVFAPLPDVARALARAQAADRDLRTLLDAEPAVATRTSGRVLTHSAAPHLRLSGVTASWDGTRRAAGPVDLDLAPGAVVAVTGPSGVGKSTVLAVLARQLDPQSGSYTIDGADALDLPLDQVRGLFAIVDDEPHVFATTLRENLRFARPSATDDELRAALVSAGLGGLDADLDTRLGTGGRGLSGGERARLSIARALLSGRPVLLLDEPVAHLDHATAVAVLNDLMAHLDGRSVVVVSHRPEGLHGAHGIIDLRDHAPMAAAG